MESTDDDDDLKLVRASGALLLDLEATLPKLLWKTPTGSNKQRVHTQVKRRDLDYIVKLIEPFQGEPQLFDSKLKSILPPISEAYIEYLRLGKLDQPKDNLHVQTAICVILYTLCKVRGYKVVLGFLNNEPRYLDPVLERVESTLNDSEGQTVDWQVPYVLLLWLSHLFLTPFDLASISDGTGSKHDDLVDLKLSKELPSVAHRVLIVALQYLQVPTKAQDAAAMLLVRLVQRPDMQRLDLADDVLANTMKALRSESPEGPINIYERLGPLRFVAGITASADLIHKIPEIYTACLRLIEDEGSPISTNAVAKKMMVKIFRNMTISSLRSAGKGGPLSEFVDTSGILEEVIDYLLRALGDRDTPVRYAAAKGLSLIILELEAEMGHEVIQAVLDSFKEDVPLNGEKLDFRAVNALKWHGLTLTLAHTLFKRSASPEQLPDIINALTSALQFEQRTATGSSLGTNVRDAANFGIWSLSRRYTTKELLSVDTSALIIANADDMHRQESVIQHIAIQLLLAACLDPVGNIRRGSSAALQELVGRHPDQVHEGISLIQIVDYQAVGLRRRAMLEVLNQAADLHTMYWTALTASMFEWRGLGSPEVASREAAAASLSRLSRSEFNEAEDVLVLAMSQLQRCLPADVESLHGLVLTLSLLITDFSRKIIATETLKGRSAASEVLDFQEVLAILLGSTKEFSARVIRSDLPAATAQCLKSFTEYLTALSSNEEPNVQIRMSDIDVLVDRILSRHEATTLQHVPSLVHSLIHLKRQIGASLGSTGCQTLCKRVAVDASKSTMSGAGRAIALGALAPVYGKGLSGGKAKTAVETLAGLVHAMNVDWRIIGVNALQHALLSNADEHNLDKGITNMLMRAIHHALNDYTIDERGDVGSLVRLQGIDCASSIFATGAFHRPDGPSELLQILDADMLRLSLEKLDRVRLAAAERSFAYHGSAKSSLDVAAVSSEAYFDERFTLLAEDEPVWKHAALLEGCISCAGISAEPLLQSSRAAFVRRLSLCSTQHLSNLMTTFSAILKSFLTESKNLHPALEFLAFLVNVQALQRLVETDFKWRNLLSSVQKSHHKSNDIPKILTVVRVYRGMAGVPSIHEDVLKKLLSMLRTNPYPKVRSSVAEQLFVILKEPSLKYKDWTRPSSQHVDVDTVSALEEQYLGT